MKSCRYLDGADWGRGRWCGYLFNCMMMIEIDEKKMIKTFIWKHQSNVISVFILLYLTSLRITSYC